MRPISEYTPSWFSSAASASITTPEGEVALRRIDAGQLVLPTGRIVACDPALVDIPPLEESVPPGRHQVVLTLASLAGSEARIASAELRIGPDPVESWAPAVVTGASSKAREAGQAHSYGVDSATGCFMSAEAAAAFGGPDRDALSNALAEGLTESESRSADWGNVPLPGLGDLNVILFSSGLGDGTYPVFWGRGLSGAPALLLVDFLIVGSPRFAALEGKRPWWRFW